MYFVNDPNGKGFSLYETEEEAMEVAYEALSDEKGEAIISEWSYEVEEICWGKVIEAVEKLDIEDGEKDYIDYKFKKVL